MLTTRQKQIKAATKELNFADLRDKLQWIARRFDIGIGFAMFELAAIERDQEETLGKIIETWG